MSFGRGVGGVLGVGYFEVMGIRWTCAPGVCVCVSGVGVEVGGYLWMGPSRCWI